MYYRVVYEGYLEGEYETEQQAVTAFIVAMREDIEDERNITISKFDESEQKWDSDI